MTLTATRNGPVGYTGSRPKTVDPGDCVNSRIPGPSQLIKGAD